MTTTECNSLYNAELTYSSYYQFIFIIIIIIVLYCAYENALRTSKEDSQNESLLNDEFKT